MSIGSTKETRRVRSRRCASSALRTCQPLVLEPGGLEILDLGFERAQIVALGALQCDAARERVPHRPRQRHVGRRTGRRVARPAHRMALGRGELLLGEVGQFEIVEEQVQIFLARQHETKIVLAAAVFGPLVAAPPTARGIARDRVALHELLVAGEEAVANAARGRATQPGLTDAVDRDRHLATLVEVLDRPVLRGIPHGLAHQRLGPAQETLAVGVALAARIEPSVDDVHTASLASHR